MSICASGRGFTVCVAIYIPLLDNIFLLPIDIQNVFQIEHAFIACRYRQDQLDLWLFEHGKRQKYRCKRQKYNIGRTL